MSLAVSFSGLSDTPLCTSACTITFYAIVALFFGASLLDLVILLRLSCSRKFSPSLLASLETSEDDSSDSTATNEQKKHQLATIVLVMLPLALIVRGIDMVTSNPGLYMLRSIRSQDIKSIVVGGFPGYIFLCTNLIFVLFWMVAYYRTFDKGSALMSSVRKIFGILVAIVFALWGGIIVSIAIVKEQAGNPDAIKQTVDTLHSVEVVYASSLSLLLALIFLVFGVRVYLAMKTSSMAVNSKSSVISKKIAFLTVLCTVVFTVRAVVTMIDNFVVVNSQSTNDVIIFSLRIILLVGFELAPSVTLVVFLSRSNKISRPAMSSSRRTHETRRATHYSTLAD